MKEILTKISSEISSYFKNMSDCEMSSNDFRVLPPVIKISGDNVIDKCFSFVDGGNSEIISTPSLNVQFIRAVGVKFKGLIKVKEEKKEIFLFVHRDNDVFRVRIFNLAGEFNFCQDVPVNLVNDERINWCGETYRRILELSVCIDFLEESDYVILDGSKDQKSYLEKEFLSKLDYNKVVFLSKTSQLLTKTGFSLLGLLNTKYSSLGYPFYLKTTLPTLYFASLHHKSEHIFRIDYSGEIANLLNGLVNYSSDSVFLGYPYGLILADKLARVSDNEAFLIRTRILNILAQDRALKWHLNSVNAHSVLDSIL